jgi:hypothetical protein
VLLDSPDGVVTSSAERSPSAALTVTHAPSTAALLVNWAYPKEALSVNLARPKKAPPVNWGRPYDLRHAAVSTWLNGGVEPCTVPKLDTWPADQVFSGRARLLAGTR